MDPMETRLKVIASKAQNLGPGKLALNVSDLTYLGSMAGLLLHDFCDGPGSPIIITDKNLIDSGAVILTGSATNDHKRLVALVELFLTTISERKMSYRFRVYQQGPRGGWRIIRKLEDLI